MRALIWSIGFLFCAFAWAERCGDALTHAAWSFQGTQFEAIVKAGSAARWGIASYEIVARPEANQTNILANLRDASGKALGRCEIQRVFEADGGNAVSRRRLRTAEMFMLSWQEDTLEITTDTVRGEFVVKLNGKPVGRANVQSGNLVSSDGLAEFVEQQRTLLAVASDVGADINQGLPVSMR
jgi:hypothetical protein